MGTRLGAVSKFGNRTRTRVTRFGNTAGKPVPVAIPKVDVDMHRDMMKTGMKMGMGGFFSVSGSLSVSQIDLALLGDENYRDEFQDGGRCWSRQNTCNLGPGQRQHHLRRSHCQIRYAR